MRMQKGAQPAGSRGLRAAGSARKAGRHPKFQPLVGPCALLRLRVGKFILSGGPWYDPATVGGFWDPRSSAQSVVSNDVFRLIAGRNLSPARRIFFANTI